MPRVIETMDEFVCRHGSGLTPAGPGLWLLPDGAVIADKGYGPAMIEPPQDRREMLLAKRKYHSVRMEKAKDIFAKLKSAMTGGPLFHWEPDEHGPPPQNGIAGLQLLRERVAIERHAIDAIDRELGDSDDAKAERERADSIREAEARRALEAAETRLAAEAIVLD